MQTKKYNKKYTPSYQSTDKINFFRGPPSYPLTIPKTLAYWHDASDFNSIGFSGSNVIALGDQTGNAVDIFNFTSGFPTYGLVAMNGRPGIVFAANQLLSFPDAALFDYATTGMCAVASFSVTALPTTFKNLISKTKLCCSHCH